MSLPVSSGRRSHDHRGARADERAATARAPFDRRLLRETRAARPAVAGAIAVGTAMTAAVLVQAVALATAIGRAFAAPSRATPGRLVTPLLVLGSAIAARALLALVAEVVAERGATAVRSEMRGRLLGRLVARGPEPNPDDQPGAGTGELILLATRGIDTLDQYFSAYLPQLIVGILAPVIFLGWMLGTDRWSALILAATLSVVPVFMILLGQEAAGRMRRQWSELERLGGHFADVVHGLTTLKLYDRVANQLRSIAETTDRLRVATLSTLRYAFLSSFVFELLASLATALVAIVLGLRLLSGNLQLTTALAVLLVAPEVFLPLRKASARFHAAADGIGASDRVLAVLTSDGDAGLEANRPTEIDGHAGRFPLPSARTAATAGEPAVPRPLVELRSIVLRRSRGDFVLGPLTLSLHQGERVAVIGPTGCGKSTLLIALLGYLQPSAGTLALGGHTSETADLPAWRRRVSWMPQAPAIVTGSVLANVTLTTEPGAPKAQGAGDAVGRARPDAVRHAGAEDLVASLSGLDATLHEGGSGLSSGERQRIGLARALCRPADLYLLDEPTAHLDADIEHRVLTGIFEATASAALIVVTHSPSVAARCDRVVDLGADNAIVSSPSLSGLSHLLTAVSNRD